eukprot:470594-Pelagomonas_calceolata.AAC.1
MRAVCAAGGKAEATGCHHSPLIWQRQWCTGGRAQPRAASRPCCIAGPAASHRSRDDTVSHMCCAPSLIVPCFFFAVLLAVMFRQLTQTFARLGSLCVVASAQLLTPLPLCFLRCSLQDELQDEHEKRRKWHEENVRRRHNYIPLL